MQNDYKDYSDTVLYDVFYEAGTMLGGWLIEAERNARVAGGESEALRLRQEHREVNAKRLSIAATNRAAQIKQIQEWNSRREELSQEKVLVAV